MTGRTFLLKELIRRDFQARYAGSALGFFWSFAQPLWQLLLFSYVFSLVLRIRITAEHDLTDNFGIFLFCGLLPWMAVQEGIVRSSTAIVDNATVIKKSPLPLKTLVFSMTASSLAHAGIAGAVFMALLAVLGQLGWQSLPLLLLALPLQLALTFGLGLLACTVHTFFRDTAQVVAMVMMGWFYLTPIVYPVRLMPDHVRPWLELNPLTPLVGLYRQALLGGEPAWVDGTGTLALTALGVLSAGLWLFGRLQDVFVDQV